MDKERNSVHQKGAIFKELVPLFIPSVHGWINTCFVGSLTVAQQVLLTQEVIKKSVPKYLLQEDDIALKCFQNFAYVLFVKFWVYDTLFKKSLIKIFLCLMQVLLILPRFEFTMNLEMWGDCSLISEVQKLVGSSLIRS